MDPKTILVTDGETRAALAATRALGAAGHRVHLASTTKHPLAGASRHAHATHVLPDPGREPDAFAETLLGLIDEAEIDLILPIAEVTLASVYSISGLASDQILAASRTSFDLAVDKYGLLALAEESGLAVPRSVLVENVAAMESLPQGFRYPAVLKARRSRFRDASGWCNGGVAILHGPADLEVAKRDPGFAAGALLQEFLEGHGEAVFALMADGEMKATFAHRRLREKPPTGGVSVLRESIAADPALLEGSERLLQRLDWRGVAMVEFRRTPDGRAAIMEINPRLWGSLQLAIDAGVDFPNLMVAAHLGLPVTPPSPRHGVVCRWLLGDFDHLLICLRRRAMRKATGRSAVRVLFDFARSFVDGSRLEVFRLRDLRPFLRECSQWLGEGR